MVRLVQMLGLHRLDAQGRPEPNRQILPSPKDFIELEERRRTFWVAFHGDRWSSSGTGWAMIIQEKDVCTEILLIKQSPAALMKFRLLHISLRRKNPLKMALWKRVFPSMMH